MNRNPVKVLFFKNSSTMYGLPANPIAINSYLLVGIGILGKIFLKIILKIILFLKLYPGTQFPDFCESSFRLDFDPAPFTTACRPTSRAAYHGTRTWRPLGTRLGTALY